MPHLNIPMILKLSTDSMTALTQIGAIAYQMLNSHYENSKGKLDLILIGMAVPAVMNYSFALELLIKSLRYQTGQREKLPKHELSILFKTLPADVQCQAEELYKKNISRPSKYKLQTFGVEITKDTFQPLGEPTVASSLESALLNHDSSFVQWRYIYELGNKSIDKLQYNFKEVITAIHALNYVSLNYKGTHFEDIK